MIEINQAIYGQGRDQGHALLASSYTTDNIPNQLSGYTDLIDRPASGTLSEPIVRGFIVKDHFLLTKSFSDAEGRFGRVFSHSLILKLEDYLKIKDITDLLKFHLNDINKDFVPEIIDYQNNLTEHSTVADNRVINATNALINHLDHNNTIIWTEKEIFWNWVKSIWPQLPDQVKLNIQLGNAFDPKKNRPDNHLKLLIISEDLKANWSKTNYAFITNEKPVDVDNGLQMYLLGDKSEAINLEAFLTELKLQVREVDDLRIFNKFAGFYANIDNEILVASFLELTTIISKYNDDKKSGIKAKNKVINGLSASMQNASVKEFFSLRYQSWVGFDEGFIFSELGNAIREWAENNLFSFSEVNKKAEIVVSALTERSVNVWFSTVKSYIIKSLQLWKFSYRKIIWEWCLSEKEAAFEILQLVPDKAQEDLVVSLPKLDASLGQSILKFSKQRNWISLYANVAIMLFEVKPAFEMILSLKKPYAEEGILQEIANKVPLNTFLICASELNDDRLTAIAAKYILSVPGKKDQLNVEYLGSQKILEETVKLGLDICSGIKEPRNLVYKILDLIKSGVDFNEPLLSAISISRFASLKNYPDRISIWAKLTGDCRKQFMSATLIDYLSHENQKDSLKTLEQPLLSFLNSQDMVRLTIKNKNLSTAGKLEIIAKLPLLSEDNVKELIDNNKLSGEEAESIGRLILKRGWNQLANHVFNHRKHRADFEFILKGCYQLLGLFQRIELTFSSFGTKIISQDEFYEALYNKAIDLYPEGPNQNGLWERSLGKRSDLHTNGNAKQIWQNAISHIKYGGHPSAENLLNKMMEDYHFDESLKKLKQII